MIDNITVVVPYYNESHVIEFTLEQIARQTFPAMKAIFVNSSSTDDSSDIIDSWIEKNQSQYKTKFHNIFENSSNPGSSKNVGIIHADTEFIAFMDCGQKFSIDWLEKQYNYIIDNNLDIAFGVVYLTGENWVDRCAVAQTYGYKRQRICVPSSMVKKTVFNKTGLFLEGRRSGYDVAWRLQVEKYMMKYGVNHDVQIEYRGINFSSSIFELFKKSILYSRDAIGLDGYHIPYYYLLLFFVFVTVMVKSPYVAVCLFAGYFIVRSILVPIIKSKSVKFYKEHFFEAILGLGITGFVMDAGRIIGYLLGINGLLKNSNIKAHRIIN